jgi:hypothetical protein
MADWTQIAMQGGKFGRNFQALPTDAQCVQAINLVLLVRHQMQKKKKP